MMDFNSSRRDCLIYFSGGFLTRIGDSFGTVDWKQVLKGRLFNLYVH